MAERSQFWTTSTTGDGTTTISEAQTIEWFRDITAPFASAGPHTSEGVYFGLLGELAVTGAATPVSVAAGGATAEGYYYKSDAAVAVAIPTPAAATRIDRIVLRASHSTTRTVRVTRIAGVEAAGVPPALVQIAGTTWDIPLANVSITTLGVITVTDARTFCYFATKVKTSMLDDQAVTTAKLADLGVTLAKLAADSVDDTKAGNRVPQTRRRQGGSATDWSVIGTTLQTVAMNRMTGGAIQWTGGATSASTKSVSFPEAFSNPPLVVVVSDDPNVNVAADTINASGFVIEWQAISGTEVSINFYWFAWGPE